MVVSSVSNSVAAVEQKLRTAGKTSEEIASLKQEALDSFQPTKGDDPSTWLVLMYEAADNNLTPYMFTDVNEAEKIGSQDGIMDVVAVFDDAKTTKTWRLVQDNDMKKVNSPILEDSPSIDMADPKNMENFLIKYINKYGGDKKHIMVVFSDHGAGKDGAIQDESSGTFGSIPQQAQVALNVTKATGRAIDVWGYDACLMAGGEAVKEFAGKVGLFIASEQTEGANGWPYVNLLGEKLLAMTQMAISSRLNVSPLELGKKMIDCAQANQGDLPTMTLFNTGKPELVAGFTSAVNDLSEAILKTDTPMSVFLQAERQAQNFYGMKDYYHLVELIVKNPQTKDENVLKAANALMEVLTPGEDKLIIKEEHSRTLPNAHGMNIGVSFTPNFGNHYEDLLFAKETKWTQAWNRVHGKTA